MTPEAATAPSQAGVAPDPERIARRVYALLRQELDIRRERFGGGRG